MERVDEAVQQGLEGAGRTGNRADQWGVARSVEDGVGLFGGGAAASWSNGRMVGGEMVWNAGHAVSQSPANPTGQTLCSESEVAGFGSLSGFGSSAANGFRRLAGTVGFWRRSRPIIGRFSRGFGGSRPPCGVRVIFHSLAPQTTGIYLLKELQD